MSKVSVISSEVKALMQDGKIPFFRQQGGSNEIGTLRLGSSLFQNLVDAINAVYGWSVESPNTLHITFNGALIPSDEFMERNGWTEGGALTSKGRYHLVKDYYGIEFSTHHHGSPAKTMDGTYSEQTVVYTSLNVDGATLNAEALPDKWLAKVARYYQFTETGMVLQRDIPPVVVINPLIDDADAEILKRSLEDPLPIPVHAAEQM